MEHENMQKIMAKMGEIKGMMDEMISMMDEEMNGEMGKDKMPKKNINRMKDKKPMMKKPVMRY
mgnify:CR=1 FL=1